MKINYLTLDRNHLREIIENKEKEIQRLRKLVYDLSKEINPLREKIILMRKVLDGK